MKMKTNDKLKKKYIENCICYFDGIIKFEEFDLDNISIDERSYENILIYNT